MVPETFRKRAVDRNRFTAPFQRGFPLFDLNRNVPVDDQTLLAFDVELSKDLVTEPGFVDKAEIRIFTFVMRSFVGDQIAFKRSDAILSKEGGFRPAPEVPK